MKKSHFLIITLLASLLIVFGINLKYCHKPSDSFQDSLITIKLNFVGDLMCHIPQIESARNGNGSLDFNPFFAEIKKYLSNADLTFGNLETVVAGKNFAYSGYPNFNSPVEYLDAIQKSGFDVLFTSNNHSADKGEKGILSTLEEIKLKNMTPIGTYSSMKDRDSVRIKNVKGIRLAINSYSYGLNAYMLPERKKFLVNLIDTAIIREDIGKMKNKNPDIIIIYFHFGEEYSRKPSTFQKEIVAKTFDYGADLVIASHPHVVQQIEYSKNRNGKLAKALVAYSLGNFFSNQQWRYSDAGVILTTEITKNLLKDSLWISNVSIIPTWVYKGNVGNKRKFIILPSDTVILKPLPSYIKENDLRKLTESYNDTRKMFLIN